MTGRQPSFRRTAWLPLAGIFLLPLLLSVGTTLAQGEAAASSERDPAAAINRFVEQGWKKNKVKPSSLADDRAFARRLYLDLAGRIPTPAEMEAFVAERAPRKREALVDRLMESPEYSRRMREVFDVVFMGRGAAEAPPRRRRGSPEASPVNLPADWQRYLERAFAENRPWNRLVRDLALARPEEPEEQGAIWFLYARQDRYQDIAESVAPAIFGIQIDCAQCHNHPLAGEIEQAHYWGLVSFFNRGKNQVTKRGPRVVEAAIGGFAEFATLSGESLPAALTFLNVEPIDEARPPAGTKEEDSPDLYRAMPNEEPPVPKFSRREQFAERVLEGNPRVARAAVNRFWGLFMGRGLVHPVDRMDSRHPASHPELLDWLAEDFARSGYDVKRLVRAIVLSKPYQLDSRPNKGAQPEHFAHALDKPLIAEALYRSLLVAATGSPDAEQPELLKALVEVFPDVFAEQNLTNLRQTMFLSNNSLIQQLVEAREGSTTAQLAAIAAPEERVREAFRRAYGRQPDAEELRESVRYLAARADRPEEATAQFWWALLAGAEFRFNH
jgi:hypothetical protein